LSQFKDKLRKAGLFTSIILHRVRLHQTVLMSQ